MDMLVFKEKYIQTANKVEQKRKELEEKIEKKESQVNKLKNDIEKLEQRKRKLEHPSWIEYLVKPLAKELSKKLNMPYEIYGPFGLRAEITIYFKKDKNKSITEQLVKRLTIIPMDLSKAELGYETGRKIEGFRCHPNSIAALNGFDNEVLPLPDDIEEILQLIQ
jgi:DNA repair exonuclease SbcCD ATPase subunit